MDGLCFEVLVEEGEVGVVADDLVHPDCADCADERMILSQIVMVEERVSFSDQVEQIVPPSFFKLRELDHFPYAFVDEVLDLAVDVMLELVLQQDDKHFKHVPAVRFLQHQQNDAVNDLSDLIFVINCVFIEIYQEIHEKTGQVLEAVRVAKTIGAAKQPCEFSEIGKDVDDCDFFLHVWDNHTIDDLHMNVHE